MTWTSRKKIRSEPEFLALMEAIDAGMLVEGVPIPARQVKALSALRDHLEIQGPIKGSGLPDEPRAGSYDGDDLIVRTFRWFAERYKGKLAIPLPGETFVLLRGEPYLFTVPIVFGRALFILDPNSMGVRRSPLPGAGPAVFNVLDQIADVSANLAGSLSVPERAAVLQHIVLASNVINRMSMLFHGMTGGPKNLIQQGLSDCSGSAADVVRRPPDYGGSRWRSLQACEKLTKAALEQRDIKYEKGSKGHDLRLLSGLAAGFLRIPESAIVAAQCSNKVRYGEEPSTLEQAHAAHSAMLRICENAVSALWPEADERARRLAPRLEAKF